MLGFDGVKIMAGQSEQQLAPWKEMTYPNLSRREYEVTSCETGAYNCIAWSIQPGDERNWWPYDENYHWPSEVPREETVAAFIQLYQFHGFEVCTDDCLEAGFEKVALYVEQADGKSLPTHAARQLPNGLWTSKLGEWEDISHRSVTALEGNRLYSR